MTVTPLDRQLAAVAAAIDRTLEREFAALVHDLPPLSEDQLDELRRGFFDIAEQRRSSWMAHAEVVLRAASSAIRQRV